MEVGGVVRLAAGRDVDLDTGSDAGPRRSRRSANVGTPGSTCVNHDGAVSSASGGIVPFAAALTPFSALSRP